MSFAVLARLLVALAVLLVLPTAPAHAQEEDASDDPLAAEALQEYVDRFFTATVVEDPVPGAAVVVVRGGRRVVASGYGVELVGSTDEVRPHATIFPAGAVSGVLTAVAALQLVDEGELDLTTDVNRWLGPDLALPDTGQGPVTLRGLLTHSSGLDDIDAATTVAEEDNVQTLRSFFAERPPQRTGPPGVVVRRTIEGTGLVGLLVEQAAGFPFAAHVREEVLRPLGMENSDFTLVPDGPVAIGHEVADGGPQTVAPVRSALKPATGLTGTATDMSAVLRMVLAEGVVGEDGRVLSASSSRRLVTERFAADPRLPAVSDGMWAIEENGEEAWLVADSRAGFTTMLMFMPDHDLGFYVVYNSDHAPVLPRFVQGFFDEFFPGDPEPGDALDTPPDALARFAGDYAAEPDRTTFLGLRDVLLAQTTVAVGDDGTLVVDGRPWRQVDERLFEAIDDPDERLAFGEDAEHLLREQQVTAEQRETLFRQPWRRTTEGFLAITGVLVLGFLVALVGAGRHQRRGDRHPWLRGLVRGVAGTALGFTVGLPIALLLVDEARLRAGIPLAFAGLLAVPLVTLFLAVLLGLVAIAARVRGRLSTGALVGALAVTVLGLGFAWYAATWHVLGPFGLGPYL